MKALLLALGLAATIACGDAPAAPSPPEATPPPAPTLYTVTGIVTSLATGAPISGATARVADGPNAGLTSITGGDGQYRLTGLTFAGFSVGVTAPAFVISSRGIPLSAGTSTTIANFALLPEALWTHSGTGSTVFTMPAYFARVRIVAVFNGRTSNFIVRVGGQVVVNALVGSSFGNQGYDGVHLTNGGGVVEITDSSSSVAWSLSEQR